MLKQGIMAYQLRQKANLNGTPASSEAIQNVQPIMSQAVELVSKKLLE
jgi:hypothetical protein